MTLEELLPASISSKRSSAFRCSGVGGSGLEGSTLASPKMSARTTSSRINPGNIGEKENLVRVINLCKKKSIPVRIGVNSGSIDKNVNNNTDIVSSKDMIESIKRTISILEELDFHDIVLSLKGSHVNETIEAYTLASKEFNYPLHMGITEAGPKDIGLVRSVAGLAPLLSKGIGDTIRISLSDDPCEEVRACRRLL